MKLPSPELTLEFSAFSVVLLVGLGVVLFALLRFIRRALERLSMPEARREQIMRVLPVAETLVALMFLLSAVPLVVDHPQGSPVAVAMVLVGFAWVSWFAIRDFVNGAFLKSGRLLRLGDQVRLGDISGRLVRMGYRTMSIELKDGDEAIVPYGQVSRESMVRAPRDEAAWRHAFEVDAPNGLPPVRGIGLVKEAAMNHHWYAVSREPEIRWKEGRFEVIVFALAAERGPEIQAAVEGALTAAPPQEQPGSSTKRS